MYKIPGNYDEAMRNIPLTVRSDFSLLQPAIKQQTQRLTGPLFTESCLLPLPGNNQECVSSTGLVP